MIGKKNEIFDRSLIQIQSIFKRKHDINVFNMKHLGKDCKSEFDKKFEPIVKDIVNAKGKNSVILMLGGHVIRSGVQRYLIDLMEKGYVSCIALNGAGMIHDFEFSLIGATTENVSNYIKKGQFGLWEEVGRINDYINDAYLNRLGKGMGEIIGEVIYNNDFLHKDVSILANGYRLNIPITVHVGIGYDIIHEHPNCDGAAIGEASYRDFLIFTKVVENLEDGVIMNFGSAVMAPEVFLKSLSMVRNVACQHGKNINHFTSVVCDLHKLPQNFSEEPQKNDPAYYFRPWKTMLVRTVKDGGKSYYIQGRHEETIPSLWREVMKYDNR